MAVDTGSKDQILASFNRLVRDQKEKEGRIALAGETAEKAKDQVIVQKASGYTVESIVKGLADLQLGFGQQVKALADTLTAEAEKIQELRRAIEVGTETLAEYKSLLMAADAIHIRTKEMDERARNAEADREEQRKDLQEEITRQREAWEKEQKEFDIAVAEQKANLDKTRTREQDEFKYDQERKRKLDVDAYTERKRNLERTLAETRTAKEKNWKEREEALTKSAQEHEDNLKKLESFPAELENASKDAREDAIRKTLADAKIESELMEKEFAASTQVFELKIESLEKTIKDQTQQLQTLQEQFNGAQSHVKELSGKALERSAQARAAASSSH